MSHKSQSPALPEGPSATVQAAFDLLGLDPDIATLDDVEAAFDTRVPAYHPDIDGSDAEFTRLKQARQTARTYLL